MQADRLRRSIGWRNLREYVAAALVVATFGVMAFAAPLPTMRAGSLLIIAGTLYVVAQLRRRASWNRAPLTDIADACVAFHRRELERQRDALASVWRWYLAPLVPGMLIFLLGVPLATGKGWSGAAIGCVLCALVFAAIGKANRNAARRLQQQIDALDTAMGARRA